VHDPTVHWVPTQPGVPPATAQTLVHEPQALTLLVSAVSQPSLGSASQLPKPDAQLMLQLPLLQVGVPLTVLQPLPQLPQLLRLVLVLVSQPLACTPSQLPNGVAHDTTWQAPVEQLSLAFAKSQSTPQAPQLATVRMLTSQPSA
jgi:hypothetical protein